MDALQYLNHDGGRALPDGRGQKIATPGQCMIVRDDGRGSGRRGKKMVPLDNEIIIKKITKKATHGLRG